VIGVGNAWRGDDAAGLVAARRLREQEPKLDVRECEGEPVALLDAWEGADAVWLVDAVSSGAVPGTVHRLDAGRDELPRELFSASTHAFGLADAVELARALERLPERLVVFGIEGARFGAGHELSPEVEAAAAEVAAAVGEEVAECTRRR
jgi:hydrogenase maturation protease